MVKKQDSRFWSKVEKSSNKGRCWNWKGGKSSRGYGFYYTGNITVLAHRMSYTLSKGPIPSGKIVRHTCDNPICCNPNHLLVGTIKQNTQDMMDRGRMNDRSGILNGNSKLTENQVREIRGSGESSLKLAKRYPVNQSQIHKIKTRESWSHI